MSDKKLKFNKRAKVEEKQKVLNEIKEARYSQSVSLFLILGQEIAIEHPEKVDEVIKRLQLVTA